jgi:hypothetical protein
MNFYNDNKKLTSLINKLWEQKFTNKIEDAVIDSSCDITDIAENEETFLK